MAWDSERHSRGEDVLCFSQQHAWNIPLADNWFMICETGSEGLMCLENFLISIQLQSLCGCRRGQRRGQKEKDNDSRKLCNRSESVLFFSSVCFFSISNIASLTQSSWSYSWDSNSSITIATISSDDLGCSARPTLRGPQQQWLNNKAVNNDGYNFCQKFNSWRPTQWSSFSSTSLFTLDPIDFRLVGQTTSANTFTLPGWGSTLL